MKNVIFAAALVALPLAAQALPGIRSHHGHVTDMRVASCGPNAVVAGDVIALMVNESMTGWDVDGDGVIQGNYLALYDIATKALTTTGMTLGGSGLATDGGIVAFSLGHGNGLATLAFWAISDGPLLAKGLFDTGLPGYLVGARKTMSGSRVLFNSNGELRVYDLATRQATSVLPADVSWVRATLSGDLVAYDRYSVGEGGYLQPEIGTYDLASGQLRETGQQGSDPVVSNGVVVFRLWDPSRWSGPLATYDVATGVVTNLGLVDAYYFSFEDGVIAMLANEGSFWGDLDGDGQTVTPYMVVVYDTRTGRLLNTRVRGCCGPDISNGVVVFDTYEKDIGQDLTGDGDIYDCAWRFVRLHEFRNSAAPGRAVAEGE